MKIEVTVGVCARNCENAIQLIIDRLNSQDFSHDKIEVIFVEEGSTDNTLSSILQQVSRLDMKYQIYNQKWRGLGFSRNIIFKKAHGKYLLWIDDGTFIPRNYIRKQVSFMEKNSNVGIATGFIKEYTGSNIISSLDNMIYLVFSHNHLGNSSKFPGIGGSIYRLAAMRQVGGFDEQINGAFEDTDIAYRIRLAGWKIYITNTVFDRDYSNSLKQSWKKNVWYGYGLHFFLHKHKELRELIYKSTPLAGILEGLVISKQSFKITYKKISFILPLFFFIKRLAWVFGFLNSHIDEYGHNIF